MAYSYFDVKKEYDQWQGNKDKIGLSEYAQTMDRMTGSTNRQAAYNDGIMTKLNAYIDKGFEPISEPLRPIGEAVGQKLNEFTGGAFSEELPEKIGDLAVSLPRTAVEFAPWFAPLKAGKAVNLAAKGATMASSFVRGTAETGTPVGGFISAGTLPVMPAAGRAADRFVGKRVAKGLAEKAGYKGTRLGKELIGPDAVDALSATGKGSLRRYGASQVAIGAVGTASDVASATAATGSLSEGLKLLADSDYYAMQVVGQVPFLGLDAVRLNAEIQNGRAITAEGAARRAKLFDTLVVHDEAHVRNQQLDEIAQRYQETIGAERPKIREEFRKASEGIVKDPNNPKAWVSPELWLKTNEYRFKTPEEAIALMRTYNDVIKTLKVTDSMTQGDILTVRDELFGDGPVTAEKLQKAFDSELKEGADINEATAKIIGQVKNRLGRKISNNIEPLAARFFGEESGYQKIKARFPDIEGNLTGDVRAFARQAFENAGYGDLAVGNFERIMARTSKLFEGMDDVRLGALRNNIRNVQGNLFRFMGLYMPEDIEFQQGLKSQQKMIGLLDQRFADNDALDKMVKISALSHELFHAKYSKLKKAYEAGKLDMYESVKYEQYAKTIERFEAMSTADRSKIIQTLNNVLIPSEFLNYNGSRDASFRELEVEAARSGKETVTFIGQMLSLGVVSPGKGARKFGSLKDALHWLPDEVSEFANLQYRGLKEIVGVMDDWYNTKMKFNYDPERMPFHEEAVTALIDAFQRTKGVGPKLTVGADGTVSPKAIINFYKKYFKDRFAIDWNDNLLLDLGVIGKNQLKMTPQEAVQAVQLLLPRVDVLTKNYNTKIDSAGNYVDPAVNEAITRLEMAGYEIVDDGDFWLAYDMEGNPITSADMPTAELRQHLRILEQSTPDLKADSEMFPSGRYPKYTPEGKLNDDLVDIVVNMPEATKAFGEPWPNIHTTQEAVPVFLRGRKQGDTIVFYEVQSDAAGKGIQSLPYGQRVAEDYHNLGVKLAIEYARKNGFKKVAFARAKTVDVIEGHVQNMTKWAKEVPFKPTKYDSDLPARDYVPENQQKREFKNQLEIKFENEPTPVPHTKWVVRENQSGDGFIVDLVENADFDFNRSLNENASRDPSHPNYNYIKTASLLNRSVDPKRADVYKPRGKELNYNERLPKIAEKLLKTKGRINDTGAMRETNPYYRYQKNFEFTEFDIGNVDVNRFNMIGLTPAKRELIARLDLDLKSNLENIEGLIDMQQQVYEAQQNLAELAEMVNPSNGVPDIDVARLPLNVIEALGGTKEAVKSIKKAMGMYSDEDLFIKHGYQLGNIERLLGNPSQMSSSLRKRGLHAPADVIDYVQNIPAAIENLRTRMVKPFLTVSKQGKLVSLAGVKNKSLLSTEEQKMYNALQVILNNDNANQAFTDIALLHGTLERALNHDDPGFKEAVRDGRVKGYDQLDSDGKTNVWHAIKIVREQNQQAAQLLKMAEYQKLAMFATKAFRVDNPDVSTKEGFQLMLKVFRDAAINREIMGLDPEQIGPAALAALKQSSPQLNLNRIEQLTSRLLPKYFEVMSLLDEKQEYFFSERRVGEWLHTYKRKFRNEEGELDTETVTVSARTKKDLDALIRKLEVEDNPIPGTQRSIKKSDLVNDQLPASRDKFLETVRPLENALYESALEILGEAEAQKMRELYQPLERTIEQAKKEKLSSFFKPRKLRPGREYIDMFDTAIDYYNSLAYKLANDEAKGYADMMLQDPQMEAHPQLRSDVMQWADNLTKRKSKEYHTLKNGIFTYFLGFNPSSMMIEMAQPIITTTPIIIEEIGGHIGKAHKMLGAAYKTLGKAYSHERAGNGRLVFQDKMLEENFNKAIDERIMEYGSIEELSTPEELMNTNAWRLQQGLEGMSPKEMLTQPLHYFSKYGRGLYSTVSGLNAKISYIIGHEIAVGKGLKGEDAHSFAKGFIRRTTHSGGEYNRAMGFSKLGKAQSSVSVAYTLNNFTFATLHMMSRLFKDAIGTSGLGKPEQRAAQKALATMLTGQFALAGALGMPFAGAAITILEDLFDTTIRDDIRTTLASISGDTEHGAMFADVATRGLPTLLGVDAQSRFGLGSVLGFSEYQGFDATGFLGAAGGIVENLYKGVAYGAQGELSKGIQSAVPQALKRPIEMYRNKGKYLDAKGELLIEPNTAEQIAYLIGFRPKRFSDIRLMQRVNRTADDIANRERRKSLQRIAENFQQKSGRQIRAEIQELMQNDPMFQFDQFDDIVNRLTDIVMESQVPVDPMRTGSYASLPERERFAQTLPKVRQGGITESQRIALQNIIKTTITGQQQVPNRRQVTRAQMLDEFLKQNPTMSPQRARAEIGI